MPAGLVNPHPSGPTIIFPFECEARETSTHARTHKKRRKNQEEKQQRVCHTELVTVPPQQLAGIAPKAGELYIHWGLLVG